MSTSLDMRADVAVLTLGEDVDSWGQEKFDKLLRGLIKDKGCRQIILDFRKVEYINSFGVAAVGFYHRMLEDSNGKLILAHLPAGVEKVLNLAGLTRLIPSFPTLEDALASLGASANPK